MGIEQTTKALKTFHASKPRGSSSNEITGMRLEGRNIRVEPRSPETIESIWPRKSRPSWRRFGLALVTTSVALGIDLILRNFLSESSVALYILAVMLSTWYGGFRAGVLVVVTTDLINLILFNNPHFSLAVKVHGVERLGVFTGVGLLVSWLANRSRRAEEAFRIINKELEKRVIARTAALEESNKQLEDFSYSLAHDLRGPLRTMEGFAHMLNEDCGNELSEAARDYARKIQLSSQRMGLLIMDLLAYTRLARAEFKMEEVHLGRLIESLLARMENEIARCHATINVRNPLPSVVSDVETLDSALMNLLANAMKFTSPGESPKVQVWAEERYSGVTRLWVQDNGIGIEPQYQERIFGVFERLHDKDIYEGTGMGLALVKKGVERMGGRVGVESQPGQGSRFWIELPTDVCESREEEP